MPLRQSPAPPPRLTVLCGHGSQQPDQTRQHASSQAPLPWRLANDVAMQYILEKNTPHHVTKICMIELWYLYIVLKLPVRIPIFLYKLTNNSPYQVS